MKINQGAVPGMARINAKEKGYSPVSILLMLIFASVLVYNYFSQVGVFWRSTVERIAINTTRHGEAINAWFTQKMVIVDMMNTVITHVGLTEREEIGRFLTSVAAVSPGVVAAYFASENQATIFNDGLQHTPGFDPTIRVWYVHALENRGRTVASEPYIDIRSGRLVVTLCRTLRLNNGVEGVIGIDYNLAELTDFVNGIRPYSTGTSFLLSSGMNILTHAYTDLLPKKTCEPSGRVAFSSYGDIAVSRVRQIHTANGDVTIKRLVTRGTQKYVAKTQISGVDWYYGCEIPISDFNGDLFRIALPLIAMIFVGILIFGGSIAINHSHINTLKRRRQWFKDMVANITHDLKTPLAVMSVKLETLSELTETLGNTNYKRLVQTAYQKNLDLQRITQNLLEVSRIETGSNLYSVKWESLHRLLVQLRDRYDAYLEDKGIDLDVDLGDDVMVGVDTVKIWSVFDNIIYNAARYTAAGGRITITAAATDKTAVVTIADTGCGIASEHLPHIFERSYKGAQARETKDGDCGLGLYIVKSIVEGCGGSVSAESTVGAGTSIMLTLRICGNESEERSATL